MAVTRPYKMLRSCAAAATNCSKPALMISNAVVSRASNAPSTKSFTSTSYSPIGTLAGSGMAARNRFGVRNVSAFGCFAIEAVLALEPHERRPEQIVGRRCGRARLLRQWELREPDLEPAQDVGARNGVDRPIGSAPPGSSAR